MLWSSSPNCGAVSASPAARSGRRSGEPLVAPAMVPGVLIDWVAAATVLAAPKDILFPVSSN
jgi:hypothetical protein